MFPGVDPKKMNHMMRKMGIRQEEIEASEVIIKTTSGEIIITEPKITKVNMMGQESFQISGNIHEQTSKLEISEDDIATVAEQANVSLDDAKNAIENAKGDLAEAILHLQGQ